MNATLKVEFEAAVAPVTVAILQEQRKAHRHEPFKPCGKGRVRCDAYDGPKGRGVMVVSEITDGGKRYVRCEDFGPENNSHDFAEVKEPPQ